MVYYYLLMNKKKKKFLLAALLIFVHLLLIFQEVAVNQVLCYKTDGSVNLELAFFDFQCPCSKDPCCTPDHHDALPPDTLPQLCPELNTCFDQPVKTNWLERYITAQNQNIPAAKQCDLDLKTNPYLNDAFGSFFKLLPLTKFLDNDPANLNTVILRC